MGSFLGGGMETRASYMPVKLLRLPLPCQGSLHATKGRDLHVEVKIYRLNGARSGHFFLDMSSITRRSTVQKDLLLEL